MGVCVKVWAYFIIQIKPTRINVVDDIFGCSRFCENQIPSHLMAMRNDTDNTWGYPIQILGDVS